MNEVVRVVIPNYNGAELLRSNLGTVTSLNLPVTVIDDASADASVSILREQFPNVRVIARAANGGFSAAVNDGIRATDEDFVVLLNNDVQVTPHFLEPIMPLFEDESVFAVSPSIVLRERGGIDEGCKTAFWRHGIMYMDQRQDISHVAPVLYTTGCAAVYRRSMLESLGGFEEAYSPFYFEDADLGYRAWKRGWKSLYQPKSVVYHQHSASISKLKSSFTSRIRARNLLFFIWRNIEDDGLLRRHRRWLPLVVLRRLAAGDAAFVSGWRDAYARRREAVAARKRDSRHRVLTDKQILQTTGVRC